jgi:hypothetical protein
LVGDVWQTSTKKGGKRRTVPPLVVLEGRGATAGGTRASKNAPRNRRRSCISTKISRLLGLSLSLALALEVEVALVWAKVSVRACRVRARLRVVCRLSSWSTWDGML